MFKVSMTSIFKKVAPVAVLSILTACGGSSNSLSDAAGQTDQQKYKVQQSTLSLNAEASSQAGTLYVPDHELTVSEIWGADLVFMGYTEQYVVEIDDADGISTVNFNLKDRSGSIVHVLPYEEKKVGYVATLNPEGLMPGTYTLEVSALGIDGGDGNNSSEKVVSFRVSLKDEVNTNVSDRF